jgi:hypothetical protein
MIEAGKVRPEEGICESCSDIFCYVKALTMKI